MTHPGEHGVTTHAHTHSSTAAVPFTETEVETLHRDDKWAGTAIIGLMTSIFTTGLVLYLIVALVASTGMR
jgi:hypothetical protein